MHSSASPSLFTLALTVLALAGSTGAHEVPLRTHRFAKRMQDVRFDSGEVNHEYVLPSPIPLDPLECRVVEEL